MSKPTYEWLAGIREQLRSSDFHDSPRADRLACAFLSFVAVDRVLSSWAEGGGSVTEEFDEAMTMLHQLIEPPGMLVQLLRELACDVLASDAGIHPPGGRNSVTDQFGAMVAASVDAPNPRQPGAQHGDGGHH